MTKNQFKSIDLLIFAILVGFFEFINYFASVSFSSVTFTFLSFTVVLTLIAMYRWGLIGVLVSLPGGFVCCLVSGKFNIQTLTIYTISYLASVFSYLIIWIFKRKKVKENKLILLLYLLSGYSFVIVIRAFISFLFGYKFLSVLGEFFVRDSVSIFISYIIILITSSKNGILTEMNNYLLEAYLDRIHPIRKIREYHADPHYNNFDEIIEEGYFSDQNIMDDGMLNQEELALLDKLYKSSLEEKEAIK